VPDLLCHCHADDLKAVMAGVGYQEQQAIKQLCLAASCGDVEEVEVRPEALGRQGEGDVLPLPSS
jgi:hypothetical protein